MNAQSYLKPGAVERIFGRLLAFFVRIGLIRGHFYVRRRGFDEAAVGAVRRRGIERAADIDGACHHAAQQGDGAVMVFHGARFDHARVVDHAGDQRIFGAGCHDDLSAVSPDQAAVFSKTLPNALIHLQTHKTVVAERERCGAAGCQSDSAQLGGDCTLVADMTTEQHHIAARVSVDRALVDDARSTVAAEYLGIGIGAGGIQIQRCGHQAPDVDLRAGLDRTDRYFVGLRIFLGEHGIA